MININEEELQCKICYEFLYETVICEKCSNAFCQECAINYKKKAKKYGRVDKCPICGSNNFTFQRCEEIDKLIKKRKHKPLQCQHCKRIIFDKDKYQEHIQECKYQCKFCLKTFEKEDDLLRHIKKNTEELFKALDLMNASRNKIKYNNEEKPKKKKIIKKKTKEIIINNDLKDLKEQQKGKRKEKEKEKIEDEIKIKEKKIELKNNEEKKEEDKKEEIKKEDKKEIIKKEDGGLIEKKSENNSEFSKKIVKKKIIKKKKKGAKKTQVNTINYFDNDITEENLLKNKMNKTHIRVEEKSIKDLGNLNISAVKNPKEKNITEINFVKINQNNNNNKIKSATNFTEETKRTGKNTININKSKSKKELIIKDVVKSKEKNEEDLLQLDNNESEVMFPNSDQKIINIQVIEEEEKISRYVDYLNNPKPESNKPSTIPEDTKLNTEYDLFFCGKPNHIDCICCTDHKCKPGACMCISCMKLNKKYHKLKSHYLINKSGRACKYSHGYFHCYCNYTHIVHDVGNNIFKPVYKCQGENICKPCEEITLLMETYLPSTICQKLRDREIKQAQF